MMKRILIPTVALFAAVPIAACAAEEQKDSQPSTAAPERPPNPDIDLGDWDKPSKPIWMPVGSPKIEGESDANHRCFPKFPASAIKKGICHGEVSLSFDVDDAGRPTNIRVIHSAPDGEFTQVAISALRCRRYPAKQGDEPEGYRENLETYFTFEGSCE
jgi:TonB family protein